MAARGVRTVRRVGERCVRIDGVPWRFKLCYMNSLSYSMNVDVVMPSRMEYDNLMVYVDRWLRGWHFQVGAGPSFIFW